MSAMPRVITAAAFLCALATGAQAEPLRIPVLVPITGFLALEGTSQKNGAELALRGSGVDFDVDDTATSPEIAVNAFERALTSGRNREDVVAVVAPMLGTQMLALVPLADEFAVPMVTVSGTARITELGSPNVFRFFPGDVVVKAAHARFAVEELGAKRPAVIFQTTAYGQSGRAELDRNLTALGHPAVIAEGLDVSVKDMLPVLSKVRDSGADALLLHLHSGPTALVVRQARAMGLDKKVGSLKPGKQADITMLNGNDLNLFPVNNPIETVVFHAHAGNVDTVMVAGKILKQNKKMKYRGLEKKMEQLARSGRKILKGVKLAA